MLSLSAMDAFRPFFTLLGACACAGALSEDIEVPDDVLEVVEDGEVKVEATDDGGRRVFVTVKPGRGVAGWDSRDSTLVATLLKDGRDFKLRTGVYLCPASTGVREPETLTRCDAGVPFDRSSSVFSPSVVECFAFSGAVRRVLDGFRASVAVFAGIEGVGAMRGLDGRRIEEFSGPSASHSLVWRKDGRDGDRE